MAATPSSSSKSLQFLCDISNRLTNNSAISAYAVVCILVSLIGIVCNCPLIYTMIRYKALHRNLRVLVLNHSMSMCLLCIGYIIQSSYFLIKLSHRNGDPCAMLVPIRTCFIVMAPRVFGVQLILFGMAAIALERAHATWKYKTYEHYKSLKVPLILTFLQICLSGAILIWRSGGIVEGNAAYCTAAASTSVTTLLPTLFIAVGGTLTIVAIFLLILFVNKKRQDTSMINQALHSLPIRYQISENIRSTEMLLPIALVGTFTAVIPYIVAISLTVLQTARDPTSGSYDISVILYEWANIFIIAHNILVPLIYFWKNPSLRSGFFKSLPYSVLKWLDLVGKIEIAPEKRSKKKENLNEHFVVLATFWQKGT